MFYTQEQIDRANQADLADFLRGQGETLERAGNEYRWKRHDSLTVRGNKWYRHSQSKGGGPIDFVMEFYGRSFTEAVELLTGEKGEGKQPQTALPPPNGAPAKSADFVGKGGAAERASFSPKAETSDTELATTSRRA